MPKKAAGREVQSLKLPRTTETIFSTNLLRANLQLKTYHHPSSPRETPQYTRKENLCFVLSHAACLGCRHCRAETLSFAQLTSSWDFSHAVLCVCSSVGQGPPAGETVNAQGTVKSSIDPNRSSCPRACGQRGICEAEPHHKFGLTTISAGWCSWVGGQQRLLKLWQYPCHRGA